MDIALAITAAPLAKRSNELIRSLADAGHHVAVILSDAAGAWTTVNQRWQPTGRIRPDSLVIAPATFNTLNKWVTGINDTPLLGLLNDSLGLRIPILAIPMVADRLSAHPAWPRTLTTLAEAGVDLLDIETGSLTTHPAPIASGSGDQLADRFDPAWIHAWLKAASSHG